MNIGSQKNACYNESQWADMEKIKTAPTVKQINIKADNCDGCGIPLISDGRTAFVDDSDTHTIIFGSTGSKKTRLHGMPFINITALAGESFIATDPKGELHQKTSGLVSAKKYKIIVLNFRDLTQSDFWNPLMLPYQLYHSGKIDEAVSMLNDFIMALAEQQKKCTRDLYFIDFGCSMFLAYLLFFIDTAKPEEANIYNFATFFAKKSSIQATREMREYVAEGSIAAINLDGLLTNGEAEKTHSNISSTVFLMLSPFVIRKTLCQILSKSSFDLTSIGKEKTAIYIIVPDEKSALHFLVTAFIKQIYEVLIHEAQRNEDKKLPVRLNFLLDEFLNIPTIPDMSSMITAARSRNIRFFLMVQGLRQLEYKYGEEAHNIIGNCENIVFLASKERALLDEISYLCGDTLHSDENGIISSRPLISVSELQRLKKEKGEVLILHGRHYPFVTELPDIDDWEFASYPPTKSQEAELPKIISYNISNVLAEIRKRERPLPFSEEVSEEKVFMEAINVPNSFDLFDW